MASSQDLRKRIKSVKNTQQITKAMKMVASARLARAQQKAQSTTPYARAIRAMLQNLLRASEGFVDPLSEQRTPRRTCYIVVGADKGLAGAYSSNVHKKVLSLVAGAPEGSYCFVTAGRKCADMLTQAGLPVVARMGGHSDKPTYEDAVAIADKVRQLFLSGQVDRVVVVFTYFINSLTYEVRTRQVLPVALEPEPEMEDVELAAEEYDFVPDAHAVLALLLPKAINFNVYGAMLQAAASEIASRMTAMTTASDNAGTLIETLNLEYNRLRQAQITNEISEIIGGANALS